MAKRAFEQKIVKFARANSMLEGGDVVLVGCSGGPDSVALLTCLVNLQELFHIGLAALHVNHGLREFALRDQEFARDLCKRLGVKFHVKKVIVPEGPGSLEEKAREQRHLAYNEVANEIGAARIALAHTASDRAETVLHNLARGTGLFGVGTMKPISGKIIRPLLFATRQEVLEYLFLANQDYVVDETNMDVVFSRNRIRLNVVPELEAIFPLAVRNISRFAQIASDESEFLDHAAKEAAAKCVKDAEELFVLDGRKFAKMDKVIRRRVLRLIAGDKESLSAIDDLDSFIGSGEGGKSVVVANWEFTKAKGGQIHIKTLR